jgi:flagellar biosynthesis protein FliR
MFSLGLQIAAPVVTVLVVVDIALGIVGRAAPQMQVLIVGMPVKTQVGFFCLAATTGSLLPFLIVRLTQTHEDLYSILKILAK